MFTIVHHCCQSMPQHYEVDSSLWQRVQAGVPAVAHLHPATSTKKNCTHACSANARLVPAVAAWQVTATQRVHTLGCTRTNAATVSHAGLGP